MPSKQQILDSLRKIAKKLGRAPSRAEFIASSHISAYFVLHWFPRWSAAVRAAGLRAYAMNARVADRVLLEDWGKAVRRHRKVPPRHVYLLEGEYNPATLAKHFGGYSSVPEAFRKFAKGKREWADVLALLPERGNSARQRTAAHQPSANHALPPLLPLKKWHQARNDRPTYGNPTHFAGLRHEPLNELGVVLVFGMLAKELGYMIESVQNDFPDCEAKRQIKAGRWQRVRIEFEFESKNFREHGHSAEGCDVIVCWRHNWPGCPKDLEILELSRVVGAMEQVQKKRRASERKQEVPCCARKGRAEGRPTFIDGFEFKARKAGA